MRSLRTAEVNQKHSYTWTKINDDGMSKHWKEQFLAEFGGKFVPEGRYLLWKRETENVEPRKSKIFAINPSGNEIEVENFAKYCRDNDLSKSAMYETMSGKRSQHKGFRAVRK